MADVKTAETKQIENRRQYVNFAYYKVDPAWRRLPEEERKRGKCQFIDVVKSYEPDMLVIPYSLVGIRGDCDFMLWRISYDLLQFQEMSTRIFATDLGKYLSVPYSYLAMTKRSTYVREHQPPTLIVWGEDDQIFPAAGAELYKRDLKNLEFYLLNTGHFALEEDWERIAGLMREFLRKNVR